MLLYKLFTERQEGFKLLRQSDVTVDVLLGCASAISANLAWNQWIA